MRKPVAILMGALIGILAGFSSALAAPLSLSWVSTDRQSFNPGKGDKVTLRFQVSQPAEITVQWLDPYNRMVRRTAYTASQAGNHAVVWDGRDDAGRLVPPEAYVYTLTATALVGATPRGRPSTQVTYDLRAKTGGEPVWPQKPFLDSTGRITYHLPKASRVRLIMSRKDTTWPIRTLLNWVPREAGKQEIQWDGWDQGHVVKALGNTPNLIPIFYAYALPKNSVIVVGAPLAAPSYAHTPPPIHRFTDSPIHRSSIHFHAKHPRARCYDPAITATLPRVSEKNPAGLPKITQPTPLRLDIAPDQPPGKEFPIPRVSVFIYVDGVMVERYLVGYVPFNWIIDPAQLKPGEHLITGLVAWRDDHFGIAHVKVWVEK